MENKVLLKELYEIEKKLTDIINSGIYNEDKLDEVDGDISELINKLEDAKDSGGEHGN